MNKNNDNTKKNTQPIEMLPWLLLADNTMFYISVSSLVTE